MLTRFRALRFDCALCGALVLLDGDTVFDSDTARSGCATDRKMLVPRSGTHRYETLAWTFAII